MTRRYAIILLTVLLSILTAGAVNVSPRIFRNYTAANGLADNGAQTILCTKTGRLVITTAGQINFYDGASFSYIDPLDENTYREGLAFFSGLVDEYERLVDAKLAADAAA